MLSSLTLYVRGCCLLCLCCEAVGFDWGLDLHIDAKCDSFLQFIHCFWKAGQLRWPPSWGQEPPQLRHFCEHCLEEYFWFRSSRTGLFFEFFYLTCCTDSSACMAFDCSAVSCTVRAYWRRSASERFGVPSPFSMTLDDRLPAISWDLISPSG